METNATKRTDIYHVDPRNIVVKEGFNVRGNIWYGMARQSQKPTHWQCVNSKVDNP
jgi:hypothetical protein